MTLAEVGTVATEVAVASAAVVGALYSVATGLAAFLPQSWPVTHALARWAGDIKEVRKTEAQVIEALVAARDGTTNAIAEKRA